ncbi:Cytochrome P450 monooxygenase lepH [Lachnellula arida]|uniref:Cytochrome P450 monooxygenase lepH n=1 Tax=Lachnellula arida TaxID=1316785 RepID=A0A8T9B3E6_9HELO|nr:Cytochrome P450 monooxygenase lepH [Lachnellula arida]
MEHFYLKGPKANGFLISALLAIAFAVLYPRWRRHSEILATKHKFGCKEVTKYRHKDKWGSDLVRLRAQAMKENRVFELYATQFDEYGKTWEESWRGKPLINTIEPANIQKVAAVGAAAQFPFLGPGIAASDGPAWKHARNMIKPIFSRAEVSDVDHFTSFANRFMALLPNDGSPLDVQPLVRRLFLDYTMDFLFGKPLGFIEPEVPAEATEFYEAFLKANAWSIKRRDSGWLQFQLSRFKENKEFKDAYTIVHRYVDKQVARALRESSDSGNKTGSEDIPVRKRYVLLDEITKEIRDPIELRYHVLAVFLPARDSAAIAVNNMLFQLARHPHIWANLRKQALELGDSPLTFEKLKSLVEFRYVLHETIRTVGPAARVWRMAVRDTVLPTGGGPDQKSPIFVPSGTPVVSGTWAMNHDKEVWGDDVNEFKPDRWRGRKPLWEFVPFWGVRLAQRFERIDNCDPVFEYMQRISPSVESQNGVKVAFKNASG